MKTLYLTIFLTITSSFVQSQSFVETKYYHFHSDFWINLHHFLYQQAAGDQAAHLRGEGYKLLEVGEDSIFIKLTADERNAIKEASKYYKNNFIRKSLLFDLAKMRLWLQEQDEIITDTTYSSKLIDILNEVAPVYKKHFWPIHDKHNKRILELHISTIKDIEEKVLDNIQRLAGSEWPTEMIRIDLTAYASWSGAYTQTWPNFNVIISTLDPLVLNPTFVEMVFHESSHILFLPQSSFLKSIKNKSNDLEMKEPSNLWHASLFYLCGRTVQDELMDKEIAHELVMDVKGIFSYYNTKNFRDILEKYYQGKSSMEEAIEQLLKNFN